MGAVRLDQMHLHWHMVADGWLGCLDGVGEGVGGSCPRTAVRIDRVVGGIERRLIPAKLWFQHVFITGQRWEDSGVRLEFRGVADGPPRQDGEIPDVKLAAGTV